MSIEEAIETPITNNKAKIYTYKDFTGTLKEIIGHFDLDINHKTLQERLRKGMTIEEVIETPINKGPKTEIYTYKNFTGTLKEIYKHFNLDINYNTLIRRLYRGTSIKKAIEEPLRISSYTYKDFTGTPKEIIEYFNLDISYNAFITRLRNGMTIEEAIETPLKAKIYTYKGFAGTLKEIYEHFNLNINYCTLRYRLKCGMTIEEAIEIPVDQPTKAKIYTYKGFNGTLKEIIKYFDLNIQRATLYARIRNGMSIEEAVEAPLQGVYTYNKFTGTLKEIYEHFDLSINYGTLQRRLSKGMTIEEAIETPLKGNKKFYTYNNFVGSIPEIIDYFDLDINYNIIYDRICRGTNIEEAIRMTFYSRKYAKKLKSLCNEYNADFIKLTNKLDEVPYKEGKIIEIIKEL